MPHEKDNADDWGVRRVLNKTTMLSAHARDLLGGPLLFCLALSALPDAAFGFSARAAVGVMLWMGFWWIRLPVSPAVTALLPVALNALFAMAPMGGITSRYFSDIVVLLFGANLISLSWERTGLDKRLALKALCLIGPSIMRQAASWFLAAALLSTVLPNAVVCAVMAPIAISMLRHIRRQHGAGQPDGIGTDAPGASGMGSAACLILACIAWGSGIGGLGTPLGGAMNLVAVSWLEQLSGHEFMYADWVMRLAPMLLVLLAADLLYFFLIRPRGVSLAGSKEYFAGEYAALPPLSRDEAAGLILFLIPTVLSFARGAYAAWLPELKPAYLFLLCGLATFVLPQKNGSPLSTWKEAQPRIEWGLFFLYAGGLALGALLNQSGATASCARLLTRLELTGGFGTILLCAGITAMLAETASNTAAAAIAVPLVIGIAKELGLDPVPYVFITAAAFNVGYMLPTSVRAIPVAHGLPPAYLMRHGLWLTLLNILAISVLGWALISSAPGFGTLHP